jgi:hypothetical protein
MFNTSVGKSIKVLSLSMQGLLMKEQNGGKFSTFPPEPGREKAVPLQAFITTL